MPFLRQNTVARFLFAFLLVSATGIAQLPIGTYRSRSAPRNRP